MVMFCKEQKKMDDFSVFPPLPMVIPFEKDDIVHLFPVLKEKSFGLVYDEQWAIATIKGDDIFLDKFPESEFSISTAKALPQKSTDVLFVQTPKSIDLLEWTKKKAGVWFCDNSRTIANGLEISKIIDYEKGVAISVFNYDGKDQSIHYSFVIDDIFNKKRLKEVPIPHHISPMNVYFTPSFVFYQYSQNNYESPWKALDNDLNEIQHPFMNLLNDNTKKPLFYPSDDNMLISEELKHALIISRSPILKKDMLFLATWYGDPKVQPIVMDTSGLGPRRLVAWSMSNTMSPSGKWVYFATNGEGKLPATHYIIYLDPNLPGGYLPPFKLGIEGDVACAGWMTVPEGLMLYKDAKLWYFDLSHFDVNK
jgi:hypothetical protein